MAIANGKATSSAPRIRAEVALLVWGSKVTRGERLRSRGKKEFMADANPALITANMSATMPFGVPI